MKYLFATNSGRSATHGQAFPIEDAALVREQFNLLTRLVPILYATTLFNIGVLLWTFWDAVPRGLAIGVAAIVICAICMRAAVWKRLRDKADFIDLATISRSMRVMAVLGSAISLLFSGIGVALAPSADSFGPGLALVSIWVTAAASSFCLFAHPGAAATVLLASNLPLCLACWLSGNPMLANLPLCLTAITGLMVYILRVNFNAFAQIVNSRTELARFHREAQAATEAAVLAANTDPLTKIANRRCFDQRLDEALAKRSAPHPRTRGLLAVAMIDLDGFKPINDIHGHIAGDRVLIEVARRLQHVLGGAGIVARTGGDEFAVLVDGAASALEAVDLCERLIEAIDAPFANDSAVKHVQATGGVAIHCGDDVGFGDLVERADFALYEAKGRARGAVALYTPALERKARERSMIEQGLVAAIRENAFGIQFQPILDLRTGNIAGHKAFALWTHPTLGAISPAVFMPVAVQIGLVAPLSASLLRKAAAIAAEWSGNLFVSLNLSVGDLSGPGAGIDIIAALAASGLSPERFEAEIPGSAFTADLEASRRTIHNLKLAGVRLTLDDFGIGYSSFAHLRDLPLDKLKIDKSFIDHMCEDPKARDLVRAIISVCAGLKLECVAEGIERQDQMAALKHMGCGYAQGCFIVEPLAVASLDSSGALLHQPDSFEDLG